LSSEETKDDDLRRVITKLLDRPIEDEGKVLEIIVGAITSKYTDPSLVRQAVTQAVYNYESQLRVFMVAVANTQLRRILKLVSSIDQLEDRLDEPEMVATMTASNLIKVYALKQNNLVESLDYVKKIADMRMELQQATAAISSTLTNRDIEEIDALSGLPKLGPQQRGRVRKIIECMIADVDSITTSTDPLPPGKSNGDRNAK